MITFLTTINIKRSLLIHIIFCLWIYPINVVAGEAEFLSELQLTNLRYDLELWEMLESNNSKKIKEKLSQSILYKVSFISMLSPDINQIRGRELEALCILTRKTNIFDEIKNHDIKDNTIRYLSSIKQMVNAKVISIQKDMRGTGCYLSPTS